MSTNFNPCTLLSRCYAIFKKCGTVIVGCHDTKTFQSHSLDEQDCDLFKQANIKKEISRPKINSRSEEYTGLPNRINVDQRCKFIDNNSLLQPANHNENATTIVNFENEAIFNRIPNACMVTNTSGSVCFNANKNCENDLGEMDNSISKGFDSNPALARTAPPVGKIKISLQHFRSAHQLRVCLYNVEELDTYTRCLVTEVAIIGSSGLTRKKSSSMKLQEKSNNVVFNECIYITVTEGDLAKCHLRIRLCKVQRGLGKNSEVGGVLILLHGIDLNLDTVLHLPLSKPELNGQLTSRKDIQVSRAITMEEEIRKYISKFEDVCCLRPETGKSHIHTVYQGSIKE